MRERKERAQGIKRSIFISYAANDAELARAVGRELGQHGISVWLGPDELRLGRDWESHLRNALKRTSAMVALLSEEALESPWVSFEIGAGRASGLAIIPIYLSQKALHKARELLPFLEKVRPAIVSEEGDFSRVAQRVAAALEEDAAR